MHGNYQVPQLEQFRDTQVRTSPNKQVAQSVRAERLIAELDPRKTYTYGFLYGRITSEREVPEEGAAKIAGSQAQHDLRLLVEDLTDLSPPPAEKAGERVLTIEQLSDVFNVSHKTISRWRNQGLVSRWFVVDGRKRVGFLQSSVDRFVRDNEDRVRRGAHFSQMSTDEKENVIDSARRLARSGNNSTEIIRDLAKRTGRSVETIRYTLKNFDEQHPSDSVLPSAGGPLSDDAKKLIYQQYRRGTPVDELAKRHHRTRQSIYRVVSEMRAKRILELPLDFIPNDEFKKASAERILATPMPMPAEAARKAKRPAGLPPYLASLYEIPLLNREQEQYLFRKFNYVKYRAAKLREQLDPAQPKGKLMDEIEKLYELAVATKNEIVRANLRLVVSIAKRHVAQSDNFFELVSDGNMSLIRAAEKFDFALGNKFSTYASWAIMKNFARTIPGELRQRDRFRTSQDEAFQAAADVRGDQQEEEANAARLQGQVQRIVSKLDERERRIILSRYGLVDGHEPRTLKQVGEDLGVTKERVRQIEARALAKLKQAAHDEKIELPE